MDRRRTTPYSMWLRIAVILALALVTLGATSVSAASPTACRVQNTETGTTYTALQPAVDAASEGDRITVKGTCVGKTVIVRDLVIEGVRTPTSGRPTLSGAARTRVVMIKRAARVTLRNLVIRDGLARVWGGLGGGVLNAGTVKLSDCLVKGNTAWGGGGIRNIGTATLAGNSRISANTAFVGGGGVRNEGTLTLNDGSCIRHNYAEEGGGVRNFGTLTMNDGGCISGNRARQLGGGASSDGGAVTLNDSSSISDNTASWGGGAYNYNGTLTLTGRSRIDGNKALSRRDYVTRGQGGGVFNDGAQADPDAWGRVFLTDSGSITGNVAERGGGGVAFNGGSEASSVVVCGPADGANVHGNTPDDCYHFE